MVVSIPAITVWQPWADLITIGAKPALGSQGWWRFTLPPATEARQESAA
jgi:hypothetical protein